MWIKAKNLSIGDTIRYRDRRKWGWFEITDMVFYDTKTNNKVKIYHKDGIVRTAEEMLYKIKPYIRTYGERIFPFRDGGYICRCDRLVPIHLKCKHK